MRSIKYIVVHCTATPQTTTIASIQNYWRNNLKWKSSGYHQIIEANGKINRLAPDEAVCNGVAGYNSVSLHVSYIGGVNGPKAIDNRTQAQKSTLIKVLTEWKRLYPDAIIQGHRDFPKVSKACPSFDAKTEYKDI
jgi:N-acetylmuramoyl-L-alanine amidase